jgi:hypothetical protein
MRSVIAVTVGALVVSASASLLLADGLLAWRLPPSVSSSSSMKTTSHNRPLIHDLEVLDPIGQVGKSEVQSPSRILTGPPGIPEILDPAPSEIRVSNPERCHRWEPILSAVHEAWDVVRMSRIMWRESRCQSGVLSPTSDTGLLQINEVNHDFLSRALGRPVTTESLTDPYLNIASAAVLCDFWERRSSTDCYQPWTATDPGPHPSDDFAMAGHAGGEAGAFPKSLENAPQKPQ